MSSFPNFTETKQPGQPVPIPDDPYIELEGPKFKAGTQKLWCWAAS